MFCEMNEVKQYKYNGCQIAIFTHEAGDGSTVYCFAIFTLDKNKVADKCIFDSESKKIYAGTVAEAIENAERFLSA